MSISILETFTTLPPPTVLVVDDDKVLRQAISSLLRSVGHSVEGFENPMAMLAHPATKSAACVILDIRLQGYNGLDVHLRMSESGIDVPAVFITGHGDIPMSVRAMKAGAVDFLPKPFKHEDLLNAVDRALELHQEGFEKRRHFSCLQARLSTLTPRENQVMVGVITGLLNKQIAWNLGISEITVKMHRASVMRKMSVVRVADLVRAGEILGLSNGLHLT
ncbi:response regulator transcription factor [Pseudomonas lutea]|uniref:Response regulator transcription factor n=1 Tax=Pseudomonas lutea TaxID=243924 RepID=A0ABR9ACU9_9PSED|nr:response regulator [Pseudomonas lutea]MBD8123632.1 response regulator transcription factor [Pseudomonas lutea]